MNSNKNRAVLFIGLLLLVATSLISLGIGALSLPIKEVIYALLGSISDNINITTQTQSVVINVRLPRILTALICGAGLAAAGAAFQALFSNPLATADTLGVSTGAAFGAVLGILLGLDAFGVQTLSLGVGLVAVFGVWRLSLRQGRSSIVLLILSGLVVAALFSSLISLVKFAADPQDELPAVTFWLMGSLTGADWKSLKLGLPFIVIGSLAIWALRWKLNALSLSEDEAKSLGLPVASLRFLIVTAATAVTAACVSMCGLIGWVGLLIPHFVRLVCGSDNRTVVPASFLFGAVFLLVCDTIARSAAQMEIPVSVLTSLVGAPIFLMLLRRKSTFL